MYQGLASSISPVSSSGTSIIFRQLTTTCLLPTSSHSVLRYSRLSVHMRPTKPKRPSVSPTSTLQGPSVRLRVARGSSFATVIFTSRAFSAVRSGLTPRLRDAGSRERVCLSPKEARPPTSSSARSHAFWHLRYAIIHRLSVSFINRFEVTIGPYWLDRYVDFHTAPSDREKGLTLF